MIKKIILYCCIGFFIACGSNKSVVRTSKSTTPSKTVTRTVRKPAPKAENQSADKSKETKPVYSKQNQQESTEILEATTRVKVTTALVLEYIERYKEIAKKDMIEYGIPASITLGQGILESGAGTGPLSAQANNHFGIKCHKEWTGASVKYDDDEAQECFRKYDHPDDSYRDHSVFLVTRDRYSSLFKLDKNDYKGWAKGLKNAGYATDVAYPTKLISLIERYQLQKYDTEVLGTDYISSKSNVSQESNILVASIEESHQVVKGDTLYSISKRYHISIDEIKKKNNISDTGISIGQKLIVK
jgi:flagellum-specific peptidoglycan hydrolase FlgJ